MQWVKKLARAGEAPRDDLRLEISNPLQHGSHHER